MQKRILLLGALTATFLISYGQNTDVIIPSKISREQVIHEKAFSLSYSSAYVLPSWVSYKVTKADVDIEGAKPGKYTENPKVTTRSSSKKDYKGSAYIMAQVVSHLDVEHIEGAYEESFYMTNIVPMKRAFNEHIWLASDQLVRLWSKNTDGLYVISGPINKDAPFPTIGKNKLAIPKRYYKVVYDAKNEKAICFLFKNGIASGKLKGYTHPVSKIEAETGINFFPDMEDSKAKEIKSKVDYDFWLFELEGVSF